LFSTDYCLTTCTARNSPTSPTSPPPRPWNGPSPCPRNSGPNAQRNWSGPSPNGKRSWRVKAKIRSPQCRHKRRKGPHMTTQAGETRQGLLWKQEHLAPLPIPTGQPAKDLLNLIWRKNDVYLDIGSFAMAAGWLVLNATTVVAGIPGILAGFWVGMPMGLIAVIPITGLLASMWWSYSRAWRQPLRPPLRFHRQRREVCVTRPDGSFWFV